jgi:hypothetical protein
MYQCRKCKDTLSDNNWSTSRKNKKDYICKTCKSNQMSSFRELQEEKKELSLGITRCVGCTTIITNDNTYKTNRVRCIPCVAKMNKQWQDTKGPAYLLWVAAKSRAKKKNLPFNLEVEDIVIPDRCPVFGVPLERAEGRGADDNSPTLDKLIPSLGYVKGNIAVISWKANRLKSNGSLTDFEAIVGWLRSAQQ